MGACAGDYDGDGRADLYITSFGPNALYRNRGDGTFADVTPAARVGDTRLGASCAFADLDRDGDLDLWVVNYVDADRGAQPVLRQRASRGCASTAIRSNTIRFRAPSTATTGGVFTDVSRASGVAALRSNGLGVVIADYDDDGWPDVFVANDTMPNFRFRTRAACASTRRRSCRAWPSPPTASRARRHGHRRRRLRRRRPARPGDHQPRLRDVTLHRGLDRGLFAYAAIESGVGYPTLPFVGFGVAFLDYDNDGSSTSPSPTATSWTTRRGSAPARPTASASSCSATRRGRRFAEVGRDAGAGIRAETRRPWTRRRRHRQRRRPGPARDQQRADRRAAAQRRRHRANALLIRLRGPRGNPDGVGARLRVTAARRTQRRDVKAGSSYLSQSDLRAHFGLGDGDARRSHRGAVAQRRPGDAAQRASEPDRNSASRRRHRRAGAVQAVIHSCSSPFSLLASRFVFRFAVRGSRFVPFREGP